MSKKSVDGAGSGGTYETLMLGMEAIGDLLTVAGGNENQTLQPFTIAKVGELYRYLALEAERVRGAQ